MTPAFTTRPAALGPHHVDVRCASPGCPWHRVIHAPTADRKTYADLREHVREHGGPR